MSDQMETYERSARRADRGRLRGVEAALREVWSVGRWIALAIVLVTLLGTLVVVFQGWMDKTLVGGSSIDAVTSVSTTAGVIPAKAGEKVKVVIQGLNLRTQPSAGAGVIIRKLPKGMTLELVARKQGWFSVKASDGTIGWVVDRQGYSALVR